MATSPENPTTEVTKDDSSGMSMTRMVMIGAIGLIAFVLLFLVFGLVISLTASETWAPVIQIFRDIFIVIMVVELILVIGALSILIVQIARFVIMLQSEVKPILDNARETTRATRTTAEFARKNVTDPFIKLSAFFAGLSTFIRELLKIRSLLNPKPDAKETKDE